MLKSIRKEIILAAVALICAVIGFGGVYLYSRIIAGNSAGYYQDNEALLKPSWESTPQGADKKEDETKTDEKKKNIEVVEVTSPENNLEDLDPEEIELLEGITSLMAESGISAEKDDSGVDVEMFKNQNAEALSQIAVEWVFEGKSSENGRQNLLFNITNNSNQPFEGYLCVEFRDASGNSVGFDILKIQPVQPGNNTRITTQTGSKVTDLEYKIVGRFLEQ